MEMFEACEAFSSLSQETRLKVFRLLIQYGRSGAVPGKMAEELDMPGNTLSFHLSHMSKAGLVSSEKNGRSVSYFANTALINDLVGYLQENCCVLEDKKKRKNTSCKASGERKC
jgi:DNA-binding transcriptional ArsR family regulator